MTEQTRESLEIKDRIRQQAAGLCSPAPAGSVLRCQFCGNETPGEVIEKVLADTYHGDRTSVRVIECINTGPCGERTTEVGLEERATASDEQT